MLFETNAGHSCPHVSDDDIIDLTLAVLDRKT